MCFGNLPCNCVRMVTISCLRRVLDVDIPSEVRTVSLEHFMRRNYSWLVCLET
jgi:hypothetical protein